MNFYKIQADILKAKCKDKNALILYHVTEDHVYISDDAYHMWVIPKEHFYLDIDSLRGDRKPFPIETVFNLIEHSCDLHDTGLCQSINRTKAHIFLETKEGSEIRLDEKYVKLLDEGATFISAGGTSPVYAFEGDALRGLIMPIRT